MHNRIGALVCSLSLLLLPVRHTLGQDDSSAASSERGPYTVAVLSPNEGPLRDVGHLHDNSIKSALHLGEESVNLTIKGRSVNILFRATGNPLSDSTKCATEARRAVEEENAVAILGPVSSNCTRTVLSDSLKVPVISSLSTARTLGDRNEWFFRTIAHDRRRLETFVDTARSHDLDIENSTAIYDSSVYGRGLLEHVQALIPSVDSAHTFRWSKAIETSSHDVAVTESFRTTMAHHHAISNAFVLGSSDRMPEILRALGNVIQSPDGATSFALVGSTRYDTELPVNTWLIGEARIRTSQNLITELQDASMAQNLQISTLDATIVLEEALRDVFTRNGESDLSPPTLRTKLRRTLERNHFRSAERGRSIDFADGEIRHPATTPIFRVAVERRIENLNRDERRSWVQMTLIEKPAGHLEGPIVVELTPEGDDLIGETVALSVVGLSEDPIPLENVTLKRHGSRVTFVPSFFRSRLFPSSFVIDTDQTPVAERLRVENLGWPLSYVLAALLALLGTLLYIQYRRRHKPEKEPDPTQSWTVWSYGQRCIAGLVIAFLVIHLAPILETGPLSTIPIPQFGASTWMNAMISGLLGGWLGLDPILALIAGVIGALTPIFES